MKGGFDVSFLDDVRARTSLVDLVARDVKLRKQGQEYWGICPFHKERSPSFSVSERKGFIHCFGCGWHGDAFEWVRARYGFTFVEAVEQLAIECGLQSDREGRKKPVAKPVPRLSPKEIEKEKEDSVQWARSVFAESLSAPGTIVEAYLQSRGIFARDLPGGLPPSIRFHPSLHHKYSGRKWPAMVSAVQGPSGRITGVHRTYLKPDGSGKADVKKPKLMAGICWEGAIRLCPAGSRLAIAEGIETALSVFAATQTPTWPTGSMGNLAAIIVPPIVRDLVICVDGDSSPAETERVIEKAGAFHSARGLRVAVVRPPVGMDFNDVLRRGA